MCFTALKGRLEPGLWKRALVPLGPNVIMQSFWTFCFYVSAPAFAVLLTKTSVLWIAGISLVIFPAERALARSRFFWLGLILSLLGLCGVLLSGASPGVDSSVKGVVVPLINALFGAAYVVSVRACLNHVDARLSFAVVSLYTAALLWVPAIFWGNPAECLTMGRSTWFYLILSAVICIALGHVAFYAAMRRMGATLPALTILVQPFTVLLGSHFLFEETMNSRQVACGVVLLAGAAFAILAQRDLAANGDR